MGTATKKPAKIQSKFALRLMPSIRQDAERVSASEGVSLNQFFNIAIAEKVERMENARWAASRRAFDAAAQADALDLLRRAGTLPPEPDDEIPPEYLAWRKRKAEAEKKASRTP
jgi:hypothetical protein